MILERPNVHRIESTHTSALLLQMISQGFYFFFQCTCISVFLEYRNVSFICTLTCSCKRLRVLCAFYRTKKKILICWFVLDVCLCVGSKANIFNIKSLVCSFVFLKSGWPHKCWHFKLVSHSKFWAKAQLFYAISVCKNYKDNHFSSLDCLDSLL